MSTEEASVPDAAAAAEYETQETTLDNDNKIKVGRPQGSSAAEEKVKEAKEADSNAADAHGPSFEREVHWIAGKSGTTDPSFRAATGISQWSIEIGGFIYKYRLWFLTEQTYYYEFQDGTKQSYPNDVYVPKWHYIDYNSDSPDIFKVRGS